MARLHEAGCAITDLAVVTEDRRQSWLLNKLGHSLTMKAPDSFDSWDWRKLMKELHARFPDGLPPLDHLLREIYDAAFHDSDRRSRLYKERNLIIQKVRTQRLTFLAACLPYTDEF